MRMILLSAALLAGCGDTREAEFDACLAQGMAAKVDRAATYAVWCMSAKNYEYQTDEFCRTNFGNGVVVWACFEKRPWHKRI